MTDQQQYQTAPEDRIAVFQKVIYGLGALCNQLLPAAIGNMAIVLNIGLGMNPALIGTILAIPRFFDAIIDPVMGYITDHTKSKWGRRKPYIFIGAIMAGLTFALMWQLHAGRSQHFYFWFFTIASIIFYGAYTVFAAPFIALGYEMTPDYHERTSVQAYSNSIGNMTWILAPWFWFIMANKNWFADSVTGARSLAVIVGIVFAVIGILPAIFIKERFFAIAKAEDTGAEKTKTSMVDILRRFADFFKGIFITVRNIEFLKLCGAAFFVFNGFMMIAGLGSYVIIFYVFGGPTKEINGHTAGWFIGWFGSISALSGTVLATPAVNWFSKKWGKRIAFYLAMLIAIAGYILKWFCYIPGKPWAIFLAAPFVSFSLIGLFTMVGSMMADLCDLDELQNGQRREGMFGAVYWWMIKMGIAVAVLMSGILMNFTGFDIKLGDIQPLRSMFLMRGFEIGVSIITLVIGMILISTYKISESKAREVRSALEARRGKAT